jgi:hypothetical protein
MATETTYIELLKLAHESLDSKDEKIAELKKKLLLRAKRINAAIDVIDCGFEDCKFEAVSILSGENDEALKEQEV